MTYKSLSSQETCLFLHVPKFSNEYLPLGEFINITYMPMGLFALAELTENLGYSTEILHLGIEWMLNSEYSIIEDLKTSPPRCIGMPLYWHYQTYDVLQVAKLIKKAFPDTFIFLGGVTASYFARSILEEFPQIDAVLQGHGEGPLPTLLEELYKTTPNLTRVPALVYRSDDQVHENPQNYHAQTHDIAPLIFAKLSLLRNYQTYVDYFGFPLAFSKEYRRDEHEQHQKMGKSFFPLFTGRGCPVICTFCGGNRDTLRRINGRNKLLWRDHDALIQDIHLALDAGYETMSLCFDPVPHQDEYYVTLFERIRREKISVNFYFENWGLPTDAFLQSFAKTFEPPHSYMALSPDTGSEIVRKLNKGHYYSNRAMEIVLKKSENLGIPFDIFFTLALPGETIVEGLETRNWIHHLRERYSNIKRLMTWTVQLEPGSPQFERPQDFKMITDRHNVRDYYEAHGGDRADTYSSLGYKIEGYFGDERDEGGIAEFEAHMQHLKCMEFCFLSSDPRTPVDALSGRQHCLERREKIAKRRGIQKPQQIISDTHRYSDASKTLQTDLAQVRPEFK